MIPPSTVHEPPIRSKHVAQRGEGSSAGGCKAEGEGDDSEDRELFILVRHTSAAVKRACRVVADRR